MTRKLTWQFLRCQEEQIRLGLLKVHSDRFCWSNEAQVDTLIAQLEMGDFQAVKRVRLVLLFQQPCSQGVAISYSTNSLNGGREKVVVEKANSPCL